MSVQLEAWSDEELAAEAQRGASACFEALVLRYQTRLMGFLLRSMKRSDAEDVLQDAFVQAYTNLYRYSDRWRFKTWMFVITHRLIIDRHRKLGRAKFDAKSIECPIPIDPAQHFEASEQSGRLWALAKEVLGDEPFQAVWLHYAEDMDTHEIARVLGRSWVWVKTALHRARKKLKPHLARLDERVREPNRIMKAGEVCQTI